MHGFDLMGTWLIVIKDLFCLMVVDFEMFHNLRNTGDASEYSSSSIYTRTLVDHSSRYF